MKRRSYGMNIAILLIAGAVLTGFVLSADSPKRLLEVFRQLKPLFLWAAAGCMAAYWAMESLTLHMAAKKLHRQQRMGNSILVSMIGQLFNCITPFASGGQPMQAYQLARLGMPIGAASSALMVKSIVYQVVLSVYSLVTLAMRFGFFTRSVEGFAPLILLGFSVNSVVVALLLGACFFPNTTACLANGILRFLCRIRLVKNFERTSTKVEHELRGFYTGFRILRSSPFLILRLCLLTALQLTAFFAVPFCICCALGGTVPSAFTVIAAGAFVLMVSSFVPLPGASGGAEGSFFMLFRIFFLSSTTTGAAVMLWRVFTFYLPIVVGICFTAAIPSNSMGIVPSGDKAENSVI